MVLFGEGFLTGLILTMMLGPVTMIILRYGLQVNRIAGVWAAAGTWVSDLVYILMTYWLTHTLKSLSEQPDIRLAIFLAGGFGLLVMGMLLLRTKRPETESITVGVKKGYAKAFAAGFLINSLSPFTLFFWLGAAVFVQLQPSHPLWYYAGVMSALAIGDFTKAWLAPKLTYWLKGHHIYWIQIAAGVLIAFTGLYVMIMGFFEK